MVKEAELHAQKDQERRALIDIRNSADTTIYSVEKSWVNTGTRSQVMLQLRSSQQLLNWGRQCQVIILKKSRQIDAVNRVFAFELTKQFSPVPLLKSYLKKTRKAHSPPWNQAQAQQELDSVVDRGRLVTGLDLPQPNHLQTIVTTLSLGLTPHMPPIAWPPFGMQPLDPMALLCFFILWFWK